MIGKVATGPMRVSVSMKQPSDPRVSVHKGISPPMQHRNVVVATPDGRMSPNRSGVVIPARPAQGVPMPTSPPRGASSPQLASRPGVASPRSMQSPASVASARVAYTPAPRPSVTSSQARVGPSPKASSPSKLQKPSSVAAPPTKALHGNAHGLVVAGGQQRAMTMTATIRGEKEAEKPKVEAKPEAKPAPESGRHKHLLATMSLKPHSTAQGSHRLQTRRKDGNKTPEVEQFLMDSLRRDPGSSQAQLSEADLAAIVSVMEFYEFEPDASDDEDSGGMGVGGASGYIFVVDSGSFEVRIDGTPIATLGRGCTFGWNFLMKQPQASSVFACTKSGLWGADGQKVQTMLHERQRDRLQQNRKLLDCVSMFKGLPPRQIELLSSAIVSETVPAGMKVVEKGELSTALYFIKQGTLLVEENQKELGPGEFFGERALLHHAPRSATVSAVTEAELLRLEAENLKSVVGNDVMVYLSRSLILESLKGSHACGQFSATQQSAILQKMTISEVPANMPIREAKSDKFLLLAVIQGEVHDITRLGEPQVFLPGTPYESKAKEVDKVSSPQSVTMCRVNTEVVREKLVLAAGPEGAKVAVLMESGLEAALADGSPSSDPSVTSRKERFGQKMLAVKKVPIFRHLNKQQTERVVMSLQDQKLVHSEVVIRQGDKGNHFFVIVKGEVTVTIDGKKIRTQGKNASFGERALLFDEPRSATVQVSSEAAELWTLEKSVFKQIITEKMKKDLEYRISIQDAGVGLSDLKPLSFLGAGAFSTVRLVEHRKTGAKYALKTCKRTSTGKMPVEMQTECDILAENDHPFILYMVAVFETKTYVSMLTEILAGGELWSALRKLPVMLPRESARFYTASILIAVEALWDRNVVYRDLKPENVMLDQEGYVKIIDFGVSKKLPEGESRTYTVVGTPHYMAPEVFQGKGYGVEVDLWSLGVMLFEFVCGYLPFGTNVSEPRQVCSAVLRGKLKFPSAFKDDVAKDLIKGLLTIPVLKRLGAGVNGLQDVFKHPFFDIAGHASIFDKLLGRELEPPYAPGPWKAPSDQKRPAGYSKEMFELFEHPLAKDGAKDGGNPEVVKQNGFFCSVFRRGK